MKSITQSHIISIGLAIFSMLFGAGNLMYPLMVGMTSGNYIVLGIIGFFITAVLLPLAGLISMILFDGDYEEFFNRLGPTFGALLIFIAMLILGPIIAIPRIVSLSHTMIAPFLPFDFLREITPSSSLLFSIIFLSITFLTCFRENRIIDVLGYLISPLLLLSLIIIIAKGIFTANTMVISSLSCKEVFITNLMRGYETLDLLASIFFSSILLHILKNMIGGTSGYTNRKLALIGLQAGAIGVTLLGLIYMGMSILGMYYGHGLEHLNAGQLFRTISFRIIGPHGALVVSTAVIMACLSTAIALSAVVAEYCQRTLFGNKIGYVASLVLVLVASVPLSTIGLDYVLKLTGGPITYIGYPILITLTLCNIGYKLFDFRPVVVPVCITFLIAMMSYWW